MDALEPDGASVGGRPPPPRSGTWAANLSILTYAYASGIYASDEIQDALRWDPQMRRLAQGRTIDSAALRNCRRHHQRLLEHALALVLGRCCQSGFARSQMPSSGSESWGEDQLEPSSLALQAAAARVARAIRLDSAQLDD
jgi:hypothetical protein